jgi:hypothetical protein
MTRGELMAAPAVKPLLRRSLLTVTAMVSAALSLSCSDSFLGGNGRARIVLQSEFSKRDAAIYSSLRSFELAVTTLDVVLTRAGTEDVVGEQSITLAEGQDSVLVSMDVIITGTEELLTATIAMRSGEITLFSGSINVLARAGAAVSGPIPVLVPVWVGPGSQATRIEILPRNLTIPKIGSVAFIATAYDANGLPVTDPDYLSRWQWRVNDPTLGTIPLVGGTFIGANKEGVALVTVFTPNLLADTVRVTLTTDLPPPPPPPPIPVPSALTFGRALEVLNLGATSTVPVVVKDGTGAPMSGVPVSYVSRTPGIATVSATGAISGVAKGQAIVVATADGLPALTDSVLVVVADPNGPVVITSLDRFTYRTDTTLTVSVLVDFRSSTRRLGSTAMDVDWSPGQLTYLSSQNGSSGVVPTVNATLAASGKLTLAMADVTGFGGRVELLRITFRTSTAASLGQIKISAVELTASDFTDLLNLAVQVTQPIRIQ